MGNIINLKFDIFNESIRVVCDKLITKTTST